jgi:hypothetical protein
MTPETVQAIEDTARELAALQLRTADGKILSVEDWIFRASRIPGDAGRAPTAGFGDPRRRGLTDDWGRATAARLRQELEEARRPLPL